MLHCTDEAQRGRNSAVCICISGLLVSWRVTETALSAVAPSACAYLFDAADIGTVLAAGRHGRCLHVCVCVCVCAHVCVGVMCVFVCVHVFVCMHV